MIRACIQSTPKSVATTFLHVPDSAYTGLMLRSIRFSTLYFQNEQKSAQNLPYALHMDVKHMSQAASSFSNGVCNLYDYHFQAPTNERSWDYTTLVSPKHSIVTKDNQNHMTGAVFYEVDRHVLLLQGTIMPDVFTVEIQITDFSGIPLNPVPTLDVEFELF